ncbi:bifunctional DNA primase/polymerase [Streptomyces sp. Li-HN-5-11]|uniref:bifunctional DNA primase/polymerase n=1 Tax=Streptomyces sp. Li-HN-5-11 TaxID=3075432 RepID=UPI0028AD295C|nr:bifunctional DNA primase/polymerase [Streptomyces sp. Li-HN-5-11]WNM30507.1 bifunctional DNA primase/polymerase [Streptomyces sp. Li-HN-5-11]
MGFTIGGMREIRSGTRRRGRSDRSSECTAVAEYTGLWGWDVVRGARAVGGACSCGRTDCPAPGAHPLEFAPGIPAGATLDEVTRAWAELPGAAVMLAVGRAFDVIEVAEPAGRRALVRLERMGLPLGPVAATPQGRAHFFVAPGTAARLPALLYRLGWDDPTSLDLSGLGPGTHVTAPPSDRGGLGPVRWLRPPALDAARPPQARLLLGTLAYVAHRSRV